MLLPAHGTTVFHRHTTDISGFPHSEREPFPVEIVPSSGARVSRAPATSSLKFHKVDLP